MRRFLAALRSQETLSFKEELRGADTLVIDDLQHICGRATTSSEFLHTVNAFTDLRRKVVITADRFPAMLEGVSDDIRSRLQGAVVIALEKPDAATRLAMLKAKAAEMEKKCPRARLRGSSAAGGERVEWFRSLKGWKLKSNASFVNMRAFGKTSRNADALRRPHSSIGHKDEQAKCGQFIPIGRTLG
jgi:hypothetical protein